jgi:penicillin-binding protein 1C
MKLLKKYRYAILAFAVMLTIVYYFCLPGELFNDPTSTILLSRDAQLLSASISTDGQWRFPTPDSVNSKFVKALLAFEDKRFFDHPGVDILSFARAMKQNLAKGKVVSGGSTISMQVIRLARKNKSRTVFEKSVEAILATRLELRYSKDEILRMYAAHAPFGGNVVGIEAACWRYLGREPESLSWGEAALLAVLPNSPSLIHPGKNRSRLKGKRDKLLKKLYENKTIDEFSYTLAIQEPLPEAPQPLPAHATHLLSRAEREGFKGERIKSTIDLSLQVRCEQILNDHHQRLKTNQVHNGAILILDVKTGATLAYVGNTKPSEREVHAEKVDIINSPRSTGSILKPFLYAAMLDDGLILSKTIVPDVPTIINGFAPQNFSKEYDGSVPADKALIRSLNVPAIHMLRDYRYERFHNLLRNLGMSTLKKDADHYGLSLVLGGAEGTLWDITGMYASMARTVNNYFASTGDKRYSKKDFHSPAYTQVRVDSLQEENSWLSAGAIFQTLDALKEVYRPGEQTGWRYFENSKTIAWKTGTSFGFRDGWAVGVTPDFAVGVWVGNADGEGRPGLTGTEAAAPILFHVFDQLPTGFWFDRPESEMEKIITCRESGFRLSDQCEAGDTTWISKAGLKSRACPNHKLIHLSQDLKFQVSSQCESLTSMKHEKWFVLPPVQEYYFKSKNSAYKSLPPFKPGCISNSADLKMELVYPRQDSRIFIPRDVDGKRQQAIFELAHRNGNTSVYWHLDGHFIGTTRKVHQIVITPEQGKHILTVVDESGESIERKFEVISKM